MELDYDESIKQSRELYEKMYPDDEFLPKAPEPEEIVIGDEDVGECSVNLGVLADLIDDGNKTECLQKEEEIKNLSGREKSENLCKENPESLNDQKRM